MSLGLAYLIVEWAVRICAVPLITRRKDPHAAAAWLTLVFAAPLPGIFAWWFIGLERLPRRRIRRRAGAPVSRGQRVARLGPYRHRAETDPREADLLSLAGALGDFPLVRGNAVELIDGADAILPRLVADIDQATDHVHLLFYIYGDDATGEAVVQALVRAAARGVVCRLLVDHAGSAPFLRKRAKGLRLQGVHVQAGLPVSPLRLLFARIDLRNHRKIAVIDGRTAYTGSYNVVDATYGRTDLAWIDAMVRLRGPIVAQLQDVFCEDWNYETQEELDDPRYMPAPETVGDVRIQAVPSGPTAPTEAFMHLIVAALHGARERVVLTTPYFIPDAPVLLALQMAAARGVRVDLVVPRRADHRIVGMAGRAYFRDMLDAGVAVHRHRSAVLHTKSITVDDLFAVFGSGNLDVRSFYLNFELNLLMPGADVTRRVRDLQSSYLVECERLDPHTWRQRPWWQWVPENAAKLLSPIL